MSQNIYILEVALIIFFRLMKTLYTLCAYIKQQDQLLILKAKQLHIKLNNMYICLNNVWLTFNTQRKN